MMSTQKMSNSCGLVITQKISTQKMINPYVYSTYKSESKIVVNKRESKRITVNTCSMYESESKSVHVNMG